VATAYTVPVYDKFAYIDTVCPTTTTTTTTTTTYVDPMASKAVQDVAVSLESMFANVNKSLDSSTTWGSDPMHVQRQRLALIDEQLRQTEGKLVVLGGFARSPAANHADKKLYRQAMHDYKKLTHRRNKMWRKL